MVKFTLPSVFDPAVRALAWVIYHVEGNSTPREAVSVAQHRLFNPDLNVTGGREAWTQACQTSEDLGESRTADQSEWVQNLKRGIEG